MSNSIVNLGELSKPATVLVEKISEAIGGVFKPYQVIRVARAEAEADKIRAAAEIEVSDLHRRAMHRFLSEEGVKQQNIESITAKALPLLGTTARPDEMERDWITTFFDKSRLVSDEEMQGLWARVLAGEATSPGSFLKRTVDFLASLDKDEARLFETFCSFSANMDNELIPLVFEIQNELYNDADINFATLTHLDAIGLIRFDSVTGFTKIELPKRLTVSYFGQKLHLEFHNEADNQLRVGVAIFTVVGSQLASICRANSRPNFFEYLQKRWHPFIPTSENSAPAAPVSNREHR